MTDAKFSELRRNAESEYFSNPFSTKEYKKLKTFAQANFKANSYPMRIIKLKFEALTESDYKEWESSIANERNLSTKYDEGRVMNEKIAEVYPTPQNILKSLKGSYLSMRDYKTYYNRCKGDFAHGQLLFEYIVSKMDIQRQWDNLKLMYEERLKVPHLQLRETYEAFSKFVSAQFADEYTTIMRNASKLMSATEKSQRYYERLELAIVQNPDSPEPWLNYMTQLYQYADKDADYPAFLCVFYRSLFSGSRWKINDPLWHDIWVTALRFLNCMKRPDQTISRFCILNYPKSPIAYSTVAWSLTSGQHITSLWKCAIENGLCESTNEDHCTLAKDLITLHHLFEVYSLSEKFVSQLKDICKMFGYREDLVRLCVHILDFSTKPFAKEARELILDGFVGKDSYCAKKWSILFDIYERRGFQKEVYGLIDKIEQNLSNFDDPKSIFSRIEVYLRLHITKQTVLSVQQRLEKLDKLVIELADAKEKEKEQAEIATQVMIETQAGNAQDSAKKSKSRPREDESADTSDLPQQKRARSDVTEEINEPARNREQFRVKLYPLTLDTTSDDITHFLKGYADPLSITISNQSSDHEDRFAVIELASEQEVLSCLTRQFKQLLGVIVNITRIFGTTVWATNYPSGYDSQQIQRMILDVSGKSPIAVRLPAQRDNKERRFFYADFADEESANLVREKLSGLVLEGHTIQAEISNPTLRKPREMAPVSHQIHLHNLNFKKTTEESLRKYFSKFGEISGVHLPLNDVNKEKGYLNNGFAFITFSNETNAKKALSEGKVTIDERVLDISEVKPRKSSEKKISGFDEQKAITIQNINETVTEAQLQKFIEKKIGPISYISLKPSKKMALVEFETIKDAGKAGFALEGVLYEDNTLRVGTKKDFFKEEKVVKVPSMVPPMLMRRKRK